MEPVQDNGVSVECWAPVARRLDKEQAGLWLLVLKARGIQCLLNNPAVDEWQIMVPLEYRARAREEIAGYERNNRNWPPQLPPPRPMVENTLVTLSVFVLLATFHNIIAIDPLLPGGIRPDWLAAGSFRTGLVLDGEWWRLITPLTLHRDVAHLLGNLAIGGIFVLLLCREVGSGLAWSLILAAGTLGNLANALVQPLDHSSVGASTAVFGTVGILAALSAIRNRNYLQRRWRLPVAAAIALLVVLGSEGKDTDLGAHFFGCVAGILLGSVTEPIIARRGHPSTLLNALLAMAAGLAVAASWLTAIGLAG